MRKLIVSLVALSLLVLPAFAQSVRTSSLNVGGDDVEDIGNITTYPQLSGLYQNKVWFYGIQGSYELWPATVLTELAGHTVGVQITDLSESNTMVSPGSIGAQALYATEDIGWQLSPWVKPDITANVIFATEVGSGVVGANVSYATDTTERVDDEQDTSAATAWSDDDTRDASASYIGLVLGYGMEEVGPLARLDASLGLGLPGFEANYDDPESSSTMTANPAALGRHLTLEKDAGMDMEVNVQGSLEQSDTTTLRVSAGFASSSLESTETEKDDVNFDGVIDAADTHYSYSLLEKAMQMGVACVMNKQVNDGGLLILGAGLQLWSESEEYTEMDLDDPQSDGVYALETQDTYLNEYGGINIPVVIAVEDMINDVVTLRLGAQKNILMTSKATETDDDYGVMGGVANTWGINYVTTDGEDTDKEASDVSLSMGVGVDFNNFTVNVQTEADIILGGPYWITGDSSDLGMDAEVIYNF